MFFSPLSLVCASFIILILLSNILLKFYFQKKLKDLSQNNNKIIISKEGGCVETIKEHPYKLNENYFIRTVTFHYTGKLINVFDAELVLENACWIPDDGRFSDALKNGTFNEIEPYPIEEPVIIGRGAIVDAQVFIHALPTLQK